MSRVAGVLGDVTGLTHLHNVVYVVCEQSSIILMYTADTLSPLGEGIHVQGMKDPSDIVASHRDRQLYVADWDCIWRVSVDGHSYIKWLTTESSAHTKLSLTSRGLLVTSAESRSLSQYRTSDQQLVRVVEMAGSVKSLYHGIATTRGTFVVSHRGTPHDDWQHAVSHPP